CSSSWIGFSRGQVIGWTGHGCSWRTGKGLLIVQHHLGLRGAAGHGFLILGMAVLGSILLLIPPLAEARMSAGQGGPAEQRSAALDSNTELGEFLKARRALVSPAGDGGPRRRVPGLRREEVAVLAGVSTDYYTRLEQGRHKRPSESVLGALAKALELDETAAGHLFNLARPVSGSGRNNPSSSIQRVRPSLHQLLDSFTGHPAFIRGRRTEVLGMNALAASLLTDFLAKP